jgi:N-acetylmuramoyl-L-alanine amidase
MKKFLAVFLTTISIITFSGVLPVHAQSSTVSPGSIAAQNSLPAATAKSSDNEKGVLEKVSYSAKTDSEQIDIIASGFSDYKVTELTDPLRIFIDLKNAKAPSGVGVINADGMYVKKIRYAQIDANTARILLDVREGYEYQINKIVTGLEISVNGSEGSGGSQDGDNTTGSQDGDNAPGSQDGGNTSGSNWPDTGSITNGRQILRNITYNNSSDRVYFLIKNADLTDGTKNLKPHYTASLDKSGIVYTVTFPSNRADTGTGVIDINDKYLKSFEVRKNKDGTTSMIFRGQSANKYLIYTRDSGDTAITIAKASDVDRNLVVIDAGHGGTATGAYFGKLYEKDFNLDIAKRLETLLKKRGINTYMIRSDDTNVDNYERAYIANMLGAELFVSIHNNAAGSKNIKGIMTLYYPSTKSGFTGKDFAKIVQSELLASLNNKDLNVRSRPDLIVLRETYMPAVIAEIAFLSNSEDRENLLKESYRQKAAQALYSSVLKALERAG